MSVGLNPRLTGEGDLNQLNMCAMFSSRYHFLLASGITGRKAVDTFQPGAARLCLQLSNLCNYWKGSQDSDTGACLEKTQLIALQLRLKHWKRRRFRPSGKSPCVSSSRGLFSSWQWSRWDKPLRRAPRWLAATGCREQHLSWEHGKTVVSPSDLLTIVPKQCSHNL